MMARENFEKALEIYTKIKGSDSLEVSELLSELGYI